MRTLIENTLFVLNFIQIIGQFSVLPIALRHFNNIIILLTIFPSFLVYGIRTCQLLHLFPSVIISSIAIFTTTDNNYLIAWNSAGLLFALYVRYIYGPGDLSRVQIRG